MNQAIQHDTPFEWKPHVITEIDTTTKERTGYIGRAVALRQNGLEFVIMAKTAEDVDLVAQNFLGISIDTDKVYKATMVSSEGVEVKLPPVVPDTPIVPTIPEEPAAPAAAAEDDEL